MKYINGWKSSTKNWDKFDFTLRISKITLFSFQFDISKESWNITLLNCSIRK